MVLLVVGFVATYWWWIAAAIGIAVLLWWLACLRGAPESMPGRRSTTRWWPADQQHAG